MCVCVGGNIMSRRVAGYVSRLRGLKTLGLLSKLASQAGGPGCSLWAYLGGTRKQTAGVLSGRQHVPLLWSNSKWSISSQIRPEDRAGDYRRHSDQRKMCFWLYNVWGRIIVAEQTANIKLHERILSHGDTLVTVSLSQTSTVLRQRLRKVELHQFSHWYRVWKKCVFKKALVCLQFI